MVDFKTLLSNTKTGEAKRPDALPPGDYPAIIRGRKFDKSRNGTDLVQFSLALQGWPEDLDPSERIAGKDISKHPAMRKDFYLTEDALWRLSEFLESLGLKGMSLDQGIEEAIGHQVLASVEQYSRKNKEGDPTGEFGNAIGNIVGM